MMFQMIWQFRIPHSESSHIFIHYHIITVSAAFSVSVRLNLEEISALPGCIPRALPFLLEVFGNYRVNFRDI